MSNINENNLIPISVDSLKPGQRMEARTLANGRTIYVVQGVGGSTAPITSGGGIGVGSVVDPGSAKVVIMFGVYDPAGKYDWSGVYGFTPDITDATGTSRVWTCYNNAGEYRQIKWESGKWVMYDGVTWSSNMYTGDASADPWDCVWTAVDSPSETVICKAVSY